MMTAMVGYGDGNTDNNDGGGWRWSTVVAAAIIYGNLRWWVMVMVNRDISWC